MPNCKHTVSCIMPSRRALYVWSKSGNSCHWTRSLQLSIPLIPWEQRLRTQFSLFTTVTLFEWEFTDDWGKVYCSQKQIKLSLFADSDHSLIRDFQPQNIKEQNLTGEEKPQYHHLMRVNGDYFKQCFTLKLTSLGFSSPIDIHWDNLNNWRHTVMKPAIFIQVFESYSCIWKNLSYRSIPSVQSASEKNLTLTDFRLDGSCLLVLYNWDCFSCVYSESYFVHYI